MYVDKNIHDSNSDIDNIVFNNEDRHVHIYNAHGNGNSDIDNIAFNNEDRHVHIYKVSDCCKEDHDYDDVSASDDDAHDDSYNGGDNGRGSFKA